MRPPPPELPAFRAVMRALRAGHGAVCACSGAGCLLPTPAYTVVSRATKLTSLSGSQAPHTARQQLEEEPERGRRARSSPRTPRKVAALRPSREPRPQHRRAATGPPLLLTTRLQHDQLRAEHTQVYGQLLGKPNGQLIERFTSCAKGREATGT